MPKSKIKIVMLMLFAPSLTLEASITSILNDAINASSKGMIACTDDSRIAALNLSNANLLKTSTSYSNFESIVNAACRFACEGIQSKNIQVQTAALTVFDTLLSKNLCFNESFNAASDSMNSHEIDCHIAALKLFNQLVTYIKTTSQDFELFTSKAQTAAINGITSKNLEVKSTALILLGTIVGKKKNFNDIVLAIKTLESTSNTNDPDFQIAIIAIYKILVENITKTNTLFDSVITSACNAAYQGSQNRYKPILVAALGLYQAIVEKIT